MRLQISGHGSLFEMILDPGLSMPIMMMCLKFELEDGWKPEEREDLRGKILGIVGGNAQ